MGKSASKKKAKENGSQRVDKKKAESSVLIQKESPSATLAVTDYKPSFQDYLSELGGSFKKDLDPEKLEKLGKEIKKILKAGGFWATGIFAATAILIVFELHSHNRVIPRTKLGEVEIGYMKESQAEETIQKAADEFTTTPITIAYENQEVALTPEELGIHLSVDQTLNSLPLMDFKQENIATLIASLIVPRELAFQHTIDADRAINKIEEKFSLKGKRAKNARFVLVDKEFRVEPEMPGMAVNRAKFLAALRQNTSQLSDASISIVVETEQPRITAAQLNQEKEKLLGLIQKPITLISDQKKLTINLAEHLDAVQFTEDAGLSLKDTHIALPMILGDRQVNIGENSPVELHSKIKIKLLWENLLPQLEEEMVKGLEVPTSPVNIYTGEDGNIVIEGKGENGRFVARNRLMESIALAANNGIGEVNVPVLEEKAQVTISDDLKSLGIKELIATGHSSYYGSPTNRQYNIGHGIKRFNGVVIKPGEEFSFNTQLGPVDGAHGYKLEHVIKQNKVELEMGGGICQVSTTAYRAALLAGLPIKERREHTWKISYYGQTMGHGLDATIYLGGQDLKFMNDTPSAILIQSYAEDSNAYFKFYGTSDGRTVAMDGPYGGGLHWKWYRTINKAGEVIKETITSDYHPIPPPDAPKPKPIAQNPTSGPTI